MILHGLELYDVIGEIFTLFSCKVHCNMRLHVHRFIMRLLEVFTFKTILTMLAKLSNNYLPNVIISLCDLMAKKNFFTTA